MTSLILATAALSAAGLAALIYESAQLRCARGKISHVIHVNGTRGKTTVCRLIDAGLRAGGHRTFCKTTGTDPITIDVNGLQEPVLRRGSVNIKEQIGIVRRAAAQNADVLVIECMALRPELQHASQHDILTADIGVITNVRRDHTDVMGHNLRAICDAMCNTVPRGGNLFTAEERLLPQLEGKCRQLNCRCHATQPQRDEAELDFPENVALALEVCMYLGVDRECALTGMRSYSPDPFAIAVYEIGGDMVINGLSINDIESCTLALERVQQLSNAAERPLVLLINNRADRGSRTEDMLTLTLNLKPREVWLLGAGKEYMRRGIRKGLPKTAVRKLRRSGDVPFGEGRRLIYAVGNLAQEGRRITERMREEGTELVSPGGFIGHSH